MGGFVLEIPRAMISCYMQAPELLWALVICAFPSSCFRFRCDVLNRRCEMFVAGDDVRSKNKMPDISSCYSDIIDNKSCDVVNE